MAHNSEAFYKAKKLFNKLLFNHRDQGGKYRYGFQVEKAAKQSPKGEKANFGQLSESNTGILEAL